MIKVFITCAGGGVAQSVIDSLHFSNTRYYIITNDLSGPNFGFLGANKIVDLPSIHSESYVDKLLESCLEESVDIVIPGSDLELTLLSNEKDRFHSLGIKVLVSDANFVEVCRDKLKWSKTFSPQTNTVVRSYSVDELLSHDSIESLISLPAIAKPRGGSSSSLLKIIKSKNDLHGLTEEHIVQPFLFPQVSHSSYKVLKSAVSENRTAQINEVSIQLIFNSKGRLVERFASINKLKNGIPIEIVPVDMNEIWDAVEDLVNALGEYHVVGPVNVQGRLTDKGLIFFEMNPRFTGITGNRALFGFNEVDYLISDFLDKPLKKMKINYSKVGVRQVACGSKNFQGREKIVSISGASGWLGSNLIESLQRDQNIKSINAIVRGASYEDTSRLFSSLSKVTVIVVDDTNIDSLFGETDCFINAASARPPHGDEAIMESYEFQSKLLTAAVKMGVDRVINISSQSVYLDDSCSEWDEDHRKSSNGAYAILKYAIETQLAAMTKQNQSVSSVSLRFGRLFGGYRGARPSEFFHKVPKSQLERNKLEVENGDHINNLLDLSDAIDSIVYFMNEKFAKRLGDAINISSFSITTDDYVKAVEQFLKFGEVQNSPSAEYQDGVPSQLSLKKAASLGWSPKVTLAQSIRNIVDFFE